jgi:APA family basic amino acid/polyamine antiporter
MVYWRYKKPDIHRPFKAPLFPVVPIIYLVLSSCIMVTTLITETIPSLFAVGVVAVGIGIFLVWQRFMQEC